MVEAELNGPKPTENSANVDDLLDAWDNQAESIEDTYEEIAEGTVSTEDFWQEAESHALMESEPAPAEGGGEVDGQPEPEPGDLDFWPSETGVQYPDPERMEGNVGGPERLG